MSDRRLHIELLSDPELDRIEETAYTLLDEVGISLDHALATEMLHGLGCRVERDRVFIPPRVVDWGLANVKPHNEFYNRDGSHAFTFGDGRLRFHNAGGLPFIYDIDSGERRRPTVQDVADATRLLDALPNVDAIIPLLGPTDVPSELLAVASTDAVVRNTGKPFSAAAIESPLDVPYVVEMAAACCGGMEAFRQRPTMYISVSPVSPLRFPNDVTSTIIEVARLGVPFNSLPAPSLGATGPVTLPAARSASSTPSFLPASSLRRRPAPVHRSPTARASTPSTCARPSRPGVGRRSAWQAHVQPSWPIAGASPATRSASARARPGSTRSAPTSA